MKKKPVHKHKRLADCLTYAYIRRVKKWMFCPACQHGKMTIDKKSVMWTCQECSYELTSAEFEDDCVFWFCDGCASYLNNQDGFDRNAPRHICQCCGYENDTTFDNIKGICSDCGKTLSNAETSLCPECRELRWKKAWKWIARVGAVAAAVGTAYFLSQGSDGESACESSPEFDYGDNWFTTASLEELENERKRVQAAYRNPDLDMNFRGRLWDLLPKFDMAIGDRKWAGQEYGYPVHREHGWYLPNDD